MSQSLKRIALSPLISQVSRICRIKTTFLALCDYREKCHVPSVRATRAPAA